MEFCPFETTFCFLSFQKLVRTLIRLPDIVGNKAKGWISKLVFEENKARQIFWKKNFSYPPDTHTDACVSRGERCSFFGKLDVLCFSSNTHFEIHPFSLLATIEHFVFVYRGDIPGIVYRRPWIYLEILLLPENLHQNIYLFHEWWI